MEGTMEAHSKKTVWTGRILGGLVAAFLVFDAALKLALVGPVIEATQRLGYPVETARPLGVVLLLSTLLSLLPRTQIVGALLVTAYLGGATATHVRVGDPFWFPIVMGVLLWTALALRTPPLRALLSTPSAA
jgi:DoxX-like family